MVDAAVKLASCLALAAMAAAMVEAQTIRVPGCSGTCTGDSMQCDPNNGECYSKIGGSCPGGTTDCTNHGKPKPTGTATTTTTQTCNCKEFDANAAPNDQHDGSGVNSQSKEGKCYGSGTTV
jgi:hypothetical protein